MAGATAAAAAAGEAAVALPAPFPAPNGGGARPPSDCGGGEEWGGTATGGAPVNAAAASARGRQRLGPCHIARDGRCGRRRGHPHARAGGWVGLVASSARRPTAPRLCWSRAVAYGRAREGCVGRVRPPRWRPRRQRWCGRRQLPPAVREPSSPGRWVASVCLKTRTECALVVPWSAIAGLNHEIQSTRLTRSTFPGVWTHHPHSEATDPDILRKATYGVRMTAADMLQTRKATESAGRMLRTEPCPKDPQQWSIHCVPPEKVCTRGQPQVLPRVHWRKRKVMCVTPCACW